MAEDDGTGDLKGDESRERMQARADLLHAENLRTFYRRAVHAAYIESALSRTGHEVGLDTTPSSKPRSTPDE
jgi:hypothetical protein